MRKNAHDILVAFFARIAKSGESIWTDGVTLYSYQMPIARWVELKATEREMAQLGLQVVERDACPSATTRNHWLALSSYAENERGGVKIQFVPASFLTTASQNEQNQAGYWDGFNAGCKLALDTLASFQKDDKQAIRRVDVLVRAIEQQANKARRKKVG